VVPYEIDSEHGARRLVELRCFIKSLSRNYLVHIGGYRYGPVTLNSIRTSLDDRIIQEAET
jgi:hypothetical protein